MENQTKTSLFSPVSDTGLELKNRIVMAPMTRSRAIGSVPNGLMATYYAQRSSAGLIITEGTSPSPNGLGYARIPGIFYEKQVEGWKRVSDAVHRNGSKIFTQLMHTGRISHYANMPEGSEIIAPSAIKAEGNMWTDTLGMQPLPIPKAMSESDIDLTVQEFVNAAENAVKAGLDGVELHGANGYLLEQFLNPNSNTRTDEYGGSIINRSRFILKVVRSVAGAIGKEKVGIRLSPFNTFNDMPHYEEIFDTYDYLVKELGKLGILYLHIVESAARELGEGRRLVSEIRENFNNLLILNGGYTQKKAEEIFKADKADLIAFGVPFISNPDFPERIKKNLPLSPPDPAYFYSSDAVGYTDYPFHN